ncbi:predicted GPI-anchored protein 58 [Triticum aestivum]|uniref:predicted GPI-anchored protein 58 n=1 Tax=Triticum aestivum TaxID=4565 RepID=UPI001D01BD8F|nr:predicted GPI-anchored protein 58 [Triticum aestivum]
MISISNCRPSRCRMGPRENQPESPHHPPIRPAPSELPAPAAAEPRSPGPATMEPAPPELPAPPAAEPRSPVPAAVDLEAAAFPASFTRSRQPRTKQSPKYETNHESNSLRMQRNGLRLSWMKAYELVQVLLLLQFRLQVLLKVLVPHH